MLEWYVVEQIAPRNHQERTAASCGGGGRFLMSESKDLSQRK
jgi:hypothetical protein